MNEMKNLQHRYASVFEKIHPEHTGSTQMRKKVFQRVLKNRILYKTESNGSVMIVRNNATRTYHLFHFDGGESGSGANGLKRMFGKTKSDGEKKKKTKHTPAQTPKRETIVVVINANSDDKTAE